VSKGGRPQKLSEATIRLAQRTILSGRLDTATDIAKKLRSDGIASVNPKTVRRALKSEGLVAVKKKKKPWLTPCHKRLGREFCQKYKDWSIDDWKRVIFSDETKINRLGSDGRKWVWKVPKTPLSDHKVIPTLKFGGGSLMLWGCMTYDGVGDAARIKGKMDADLYVSILEDDLLSTLDYYDYLTDNVIF
jgi:hypothetical protein